MSLDLHKLQFQAVHHVSHQLNVVTYLLFFVELHAAEIPNGRLHKILGFSMSLYGDNAAVSSLSAHVHPSPADDYMCALVPAA